MIDRARERLTTALDGLMSDEQARFEALVTDGAALRALGTELRSAVAVPTTDDGGPSAASGVGG
jgi:hypothetical protein